MRSGGVVFKETNGILVAILAYTNSVNGNSGGYNSGELMAAVNFIDEQSVIEDIQSAKDNGADIVVIAMHTGEERLVTPSGWQVDWSRKFIAAGADIVFGAHPHVLQPIERITAGEGAEERTGYAFYSLGNFISNMDGDDCARGMVAYVEVQKDQDGARIKEVYYLPTYFYRGGGEYAVLPCNPGAQKELISKRGENIAKTAAGAYLRTVEFLGEDAARALE